ncbi:adenosylcobinamide-GDP ribazoletransferase [Puniceicoccus vermicola]|uniref:Adenosylcobinamide-GDP ribazoletransferase n=1 Tax=Puniceicoccus vermicola TaxID=388746 RepID=A0A7X1E592_9BACT|nr:adenosylcobinamide-GDP ribazoletransferase [Puniceicoccus vermicola]MBC2602884.1 adenosylcobinamide-GDP ribazoletransferase [Puniceicoccus vermicola]
MLSGLVTALRLLSILPIPGREARNFCDGLYWYPLAGFILGALVTGVSWSILLVVPQWPELSAFVALACTVIVTRGLHLDGVADCADGFWGEHTPERRLEIMKDSRTGAFGVIALILILLAKSVFYTRIFTEENYWLIPLAFAVSRFTLTVLALCFRYPRKVGTAATIVQGAHLRHLLGATALTLLLGIYAPLAVLPIFFVGLLIAVSLGFLARSRIQGVTGDVFGAACELSELGGLLVIALL